jgi:hypothetical protein
VPNVPPFLEDTRNEGLSPPAAVWQLLQDDKDDPGRRVASNRRLSVREHVFVRRSLCEPHHFPAVMTITAAAPWHGYTPAS